MGEADTLRVEGSEDVCIYTAFSNPPGPGIAPVELRLHDRRLCGGHLYIDSPSWSKWVYPAASAIDTALPVPPEYFHINLSQKPDWVPVPEGPGHVHFEAVPEESMEDWHRRHGLYS